MGLGHLPGCCLHRLKPPGRLHLHLRSTTWCPPTPQANHLASSPSPHPLIHPHPHSTHPHSTPRTLFHPHPHSTHPRDNKPETDDDRRFDLLTRELVYEAKGQPADRMPQGEGGVG